MILNRVCVCVTEHEGRRHQGLRETTDEETDERQVAAGTGRLVEGVEGSEEGRHEEVSIILFYWNGQKLVCTLCLGVHVTSDVITYHFSACRRRGTIERRLTLLRKT